MATLTKDTISKIVTNKYTQDILHAYGLKAHSVTWEDTA
jgi:hypothetical protein